MTASSAIRRSGRWCACILTFGLLGNALPSRAQSADSAVALHQAAREGNMPEMRRLIDSGFDVGTISAYGAVDRIGATPLHYAAMHGRVEAIELLLANEAELEALALPYRYTPLQLAARMGQLAAVEALLAAGSTVNARDATGTTALHQAARNGHLQILKALLQNGANPAQTDLAGKSPAYWADSLGHHDVVRTLHGYSAP